MSAADTTAGKWLIGVSLVGGLIGGLLVHLASWPAAAAVMICGLLLIERPRDLVRCVAFVAGVAANLTAAAHLLVDSGWPLVSASVLLTCAIGLLLHSMRRPSMPQHR